MGEKEITIDFRELSKMEVYCANCGAGCLLDWTKQQAFPLNCAVCSVQFSQSARKAMSVYQIFYREAVNGEVNIQFRVKAP